MKAIGEWTYAQNVKEFDYLREVLNGPVLQYLQAICRYGGPQGGESDEGSSSLLQNAGSIVLSHLKDMSGLAQKASLRKHTRTSAMSAFSTFESETDVLNGSNHSFAHVPAFFEQLSNLHAKLRRAGDMAHLDALEAQTT